MRRLLVLLLAVAAALAAGGLAGGTHWMPEHYTWTDLTATGDRHISYLLCGIPYDLPPEWQQGVENWDVAMSSVMEFDLQSGGCFDSADTWLA